MLVTVGGLGVAAVLALGLMAQRYGSVVNDRLESQRRRESARAERVTVPAPQPSTTTPRPVVPRVASDGSEEDAVARAERYVSAFLDVRRAMRRALDEQGSAASLAAQTERARQARDAELGRSWMAEHEYRQMLTIYRAWLADARPPTEPFASVFEKHREDASRLSLGPLDRLDL
jgi:hypothetical protein